MLSCLNELGYMVEWRVINAAEYGMPQRRRRIFIVGYLKDTKIAKSFDKLNNVDDWLNYKGVIASEFKVDSKKSGKMLDFKIEGSPQKTSDTFNQGAKLSPFANTGVMKDGLVNTLRTFPKNLKEGITLGDILVDNLDVEDEFYIDPKTPTKETIVREQLGANDIIIRTELEMWKYLKGKKKEPRKSKSGGYTYNFAEGKMTFP